MRFIAQFPSLLLIASALCAEPPKVTEAQHSEVPGITLPRAIHKVEPKYSREARDAHIQGAVHLLVTIDERGEIASASVIRSIGYGLDEEAGTAVRKWRFAPAMMNGRPVKTVVVIDVNFHLLSLASDAAEERQRTDFNAAWETVNQPGAAQTDVDQAVQRILNLSRKKYPPAMGVAGVWTATGNHVAKDLPRGLDLIRKAAAKNYAPALYQLACRHIEGRDLPINVEQGLEEMYAAADRGSRLAQLDLGKRYEAGDSIAADPDRARKYLTLCAAQGVAQCRLRLGLLLRQSPQIPLTDEVLSVALLQLAADSGLAEATDPAAAAALQLGPAHLVVVNMVKRSILGR